MNKGHKIKRPDAALQRRERERLARRAAILKAARKVFFRRGFMDATVGEIAGKCGLAKGTIYLYFRSKEDLYVSVMAEGMGLLKNEMERVRAFDLGSDRLVEKAAELYYGFYKKNGEYFRIMFLSSQPDLRSRVSEDLLRGSVEAGKASMRVLSDIVRRGVGEGTFREVDPWLTANILWAMVNGIIMAHDQDPICREEILCHPLEDILGEAVRMALDGLRVRR